MSAHFPASGTIRVTLAKSGSGLRHGRPLGACRIMCRLLALGLIVPASASAHPHHAGDGSVSFSIADTFFHLLPRSVLIAGMAAGLAVLLRLLAGALTRSRWVTGRGGASTSEITDRSASHGCAITAAHGTLEPGTLGESATELQEGKGRDGWTSPLRVLLLSVICSLPITSGCSGGGSDSGGGGGDGTSRSTKTGVRVLHGALDFEPVDLRIGDEYVGHSAFLESNFYHSIGRGAQTIVIERAHSPGIVLGQIQKDFQDKTEYSVVLSGQVSNNTFQALLLEEPIVRPDAGQARVQFVNLLENSTQLRAVGAGVTLGPTPFRLSSGFTTVAPGIQSFQIFDSRGGVVASLTVDVADRGEATIVIGGDLRQSVAIARVYTDLD